jgi:tetratricopeptide (TPR) repeat protein
MISREGCAKITDFGLAKFYQEFCSGGTLGYIAPEVYEHPSRVDIRSDIYSFGIVLWQMASGNPFPPFWGKSPDFNRLAKDIYQAQTTRLPTRIDTPLWPVIERCLKVSPNERYKDFKELRFDFKKFSINGANKISSKSEYAIHDEFNSLITRGFSLHCLGKESEAEGFLRKALTINPRSWHAYNNLGFVLRARNKPQEAIRCFEKATQIAPNDWIPAHGLGTTFLMQGRLREALMCLDRAVNNCSDNPGILSDRALVLSELGSYDNAERDYMRAIRLAPHDAKIIVVRALNLMRMRNWQKAIDCMDCHILDIQSNPHCWALSVEIRCECKKALRRC